MIQISKQVDYASQLLQEIKKLKKDEYLSLKNFSEEKEISFLFLQRIARILKTANIIKSKRGTKGGYYLNSKIKKLSLKRLMEIIDGSFGISKCTRIIFDLNTGKQKKCQCKREKNCNNRKIFLKLNREISVILDKIIII